MPWPSNLPVIGAYFLVLRGRSGAGAHLGAGSAGHPTPSKGSGLGKALLPRQPNNNQNSQELLSVESCGGANTPDQGHPSHDGWAWSVLGTRSTNKHLHLHPGHPASHRSENNSIPVPCDLPSSKHIMWPDPSDAKYHCWGQENALHGLTEMAGLLIYLQEKVCPPPNIINYGFLTNDFCVDKIKRGQWKDIQKILLCAQNTKGVGVRLPVLPPSEATLKLPIEICWIFFSCWKYFGGKEFMNKETQKWKHAKKITTFMGQKKI